MNSIKDRKNDIQLQHFQFSLEMISKGLFVIVGAIVLAFMNMVIILVDSKAKWALLSLQVVYFCLTTRNGVFTLVVFPQRLSVFMLGCFGFNQFSNIYFGITKAQVTSNMCLLVASFIMEALHHWNKYRRNRSNLRMN